MNTPKTISDSEVQEMICLLRCFVLDQDNYSDELDAAAALLNRIGELPAGVCPLCGASWFAEYSDTIEQLDGMDSDQRPADASPDHAYWCTNCEQSFGVKRA